MDLAQPFRLNDWLVDPVVDEISRDGAVIRIEQRQMKVLLLLARHAGEVVSVQSIEEVVWGDEIVSPNSLHRAISQLRLALGDDAKAPRYIETVPRRGYRIIAAIEVENPPEGSCQSGSVEEVTVVTSAGEACAESSAPEPSCDQVQATVIEGRRSTVPRRALVLLGAASLILLVVGIVWERVEGRRAAAARDRADQLADFMVNVFSRDASVARRPTASELADYAAQRISTDIPQQSEVRAKMYEVIAISYVNSGFSERAVAPLQEALQIRRKASQDADVAETLRWLGETYLNLRKFDESASAYREALETLRSSKGESSREYALTIGGLGTLEVYRSHPDAALKLLNGSLQQMRAIVGPRHSNVADILTTVSAAHLNKGDLTQAERAAREAIRIYTHSRPDLDPSRVVAEYYLGDTLFYQGRLDEAAKVLERVRDVQLRLYGARTVSFAATLESLGDVYFAQGRVGEGEEQKEEAIAILEDLGERGRGYDTLASTKVSLSIQLLESGRLSRAEQLLREAIDLYAQSSNPPTLCQACEHFMAEALLAQGRLEEAESFARSAVDTYSKSDYEPWFTERSKSTLGEILYRRGQKAEGKRLILESSQRLASDASARPAAKDKARQRMRLVSAPQ